MAQKLNAVVYPQKITNSPYVAGVRGSQVGKTKMDINTPLSHMMELRNWQRQKINNTIVLEDECPGNVLSEELLKILDI